MDNNFINNTFTWALEDTSANKQINNQANINQQQQSQEIVNLSDADLFQFLLGEEAHQAAMTQTHSVSHHTDEDSSANEDLVMKERPSSSSNTASSNTTRKPKSSNGPPATSTGRLDFRPIHDHIPESQLKAMTSKERRQLRNKISARNFRNRRKGKFY